MARATVAGSSFLILILIVIVILISFGKTEITITITIRIRIKTRIPPCVAGELRYVPVIMFEKIKVQLPAAAEKIAHLRRFL
jgi:hypothetical protein